ncbi:RNA-binding S4 domain-containing protein [Telmatospirillum sp. J64-1]|uniref:RNA-binding S4 domain-containing protein n=1 Tax=Telmatospirillum sp. J64-1 TaxID=2502183 RepID=UPI00115DA0B4|nr:RNA-binding S4 domain-containing protein [Telmatospirillum sp. J64-1]
MNETLRIDKWLWFARFCKSRSLAASLCEEGEIHLNDRPAGKAQSLKTGDIVEFPAGPRRRRRVRVLALGERRGPAPEAQLLYEELDSVPVRED